MSGAANQCLAASELLKTVQHTPFICFGIDGMYVYKNRTKPAAPRLNYGSVHRDHLLAAVVRVDHPTWNRADGFQGEGEGKGMGKGRGNSMNERVYRLRGIHAWHALTHA